MSGISELLNEVISLSFKNEKDKKSLNVYIKQINLLLNSENETNKNKNHVKSKIINIVADETSIAKRIYLLDLLDKTNINIEDDENQSIKADLTTDILNMQNDNDIEYIKNILHNVGVNTSYMILAYILENIEEMTGYGTKKEEKATKINLINKLYVGINEDVKVSSNLFGLTIFLAAEHKNIELVNLFGEIMPKTVRLLAVHNLKHFQETSIEFEELKKLMPQNIMGSLKNGQDFLFIAKIRTGNSLYKYLSDDDKKEFIDEVLSYGYVKRAAGDIDEVKKNKVLMDKKYLTDRIKSSTQKTIKKKIF